MDSQIALAGFESPEYHEMEFLSSIEPDFRIAIENAGGPSKWLSITATDSYTAVKFGILTAFRLRVRKGQHYILIPDTLEDLIPSNALRKKNSADGKYTRVLITSKSPLAIYRDFLIRIVVETVNRYPKEWDCCSRYLECSDAKTCVHPNKESAVVCGYRKILSSGRIFYGKNRSVDA